MLMDRYLHMQSDMIGPKAMNTTIHQRKHIFSCVHVLMNLNQEQHKDFIHFSRSFVIERKYTSIN